MIRKHKNAGTVTNLNVVTPPKDHASSLAKGQNENSEMANEELKVWIAMKLKEIQGKVENQHKSYPGSEGRGIYLVGEKKTSGNKKNT